MRIIYGILSCLLFSVSSFSQTKPCTLTLKDSPTIRSIRLGTTTKDFLTLTKGYNYQLEPKYVARNFDSPPSELFKGVESVEVSDYQNKTTGI